MTQNTSKTNPIADLKSSLVVTLVAIPLCLGISLASGAPLFAGLIAGIIGGIIIGLLGGSEVSVAGPAAGLTVIVATGIATMGSFHLFSAALILAGILQFAFGFLGTGKLARLFPSTVIQGMLAAIGIIIITKQLPYAFGWVDGYPTVGSAFAALLSIAVILGWDHYLKDRMGPLKVVPGALLAVIFSAIAIAIEPTHIPMDQMVAIPAGTEFSLIVLPTFDQLHSFDFWKLVVTIAIVASLETLLALEATDKLDKHRRSSNKDRELKAHGLGNALSGMFGGLPITSVVVRSSANIQHGATSRWSTVLHGVWILLAVLLFPQILNTIPLSSLAAILILVGCKLVAPAQFLQMWNRGWRAFTPFIATITAILLTDLLTGIVIGMMVGIACSARFGFREALGHTKHEHGHHLHFQSHVTWLNKNHLRTILYSLPQGAKIAIDGSNSLHIDEDIIDMLKDFEQHAHPRSIKVNYLLSPIALHPFFRKKEDDSLESKVVLD